MFRKNYLIYVLMIAAILIGNTAVFAQNSSVSGRVQMTDEKGNKKPVANLLVEVYLTDTLKGEPVSGKTDEKGDFKIDNLPTGKKFALVISGENIEPSVVTDISSGASNLAIPVKTGKGNQPSADLVRQSLSASGKLELSAEEKAEIEANIKEIESKNAKSANSNEITKRAIEEGNKAFKDKNYDLAITKYEEGYQADTAFVGSAPIFLNNKGAALLKRAVDYYNKSVTSAGDQTAKIENSKKSSKDFSDGIDAYYTAWTILKNTPEADKKSVAGYEENKARTLTGARDLLDLSVQTGKADPEKLSKVKELLNEYVNFESDKKKKPQGETLLADYYRLSFDYDTAIAMYRKTLSSSPDEPGALYGLGLSLFTAAYGDDGSIDKAKLQEAANILKHFTDVAPSTAKRELKAAEETLDALKNGENISPKKG